MDKGKETATEPCHLIKMSEVVTTGDISCWRIFPNWAAAESKASSFSPCTYTGTCARKPTWMQHEMLWRLIMQSFGRRDLNRSVGAEIWADCSLCFSCAEPSLLPCWSLCHQAVLLGRGHVGESLLHHQQQPECIFLLVLYLRESSRCDCRSSL